MERTLYGDLLAWKSSRRRKPLLLRGARQTGKTYLLSEFGMREYEQVVYCDFQEDPALDSFFQRDLDPHRIIRELSVYKGTELRPERDLLIFDEVQTSSSALNSLKYFSQRAPSYHVAAAGSLLGILLSRPGSFPVGKVSFLDLFPMTFVEFLAAVGKPQYAALLTELKEPEPLPEAFHVDLVALLRQYTFVGGMPEAVRDFIETGDPGSTRRIHKELLDSFVLDFAKHAPATDIPKLGLIWESIPRHLGGENKKFLFTHIKKGARAREFENALRWLDDAGLVNLCHAVSASRPPLKHYQDQRCFKVYALDVGLLGAMARTPPEILTHGDALFTEFRGAMTESYVAQQLLASGHPELHYWRSPGGKAEIDFLIEHMGGVFPVEVKAGLSRRSKSLASYDHQFSPHTLVRANLRNLKRDGKICNIPLYAVSQLSKFVV